MLLTLVPVFLYTSFKINAEVQMERIRQLRKEQGLSQAKLAVMADMDPATLNRLERGTGNPNLKTLERVAEALGVEVADFFLPKAPRRSLLEPTLLNGLEDERHLSRFSEAIIAVAARWGEAMSSPDMKDTKRFGLIEAALDLSGVIEERVEEEDWEAIPNRVRLEIVTTMEKLVDAANLGLRHAEESGEARDQEEQVNQRREQMRELTRRISV
jgi:transcriptional regulator with XRE-family HTH domain